MEIYVVSTSASNVLAKNPAGLEWRASLVSVTTAQARALRGRGLPSSAGRGRLWCPQNSRRPPITKPEGRLPSLNFDLSGQL